MNLRLQPHGSQYDARTYDKIYTGVCLLPSLDLERGGESTQQQRFNACEIFTCH